MGCFRVYQKTTKQKYIVESLVVKYEVKFFFTRNKLKMIEVATDKKIL